MKKVFSLALAMALAFCMSVTAWAAAYDNAYAWYDNCELNGYPDYVANVFSADGSYDHLTVLVTGEEYVAKVEVEITDTSTLTVEADEDAIPYNDLITARDAIIADYMTNGDEQVVSCGIGMSYDEEGNLVGFGSTGHEARVLVAVLEESYEEISAELTEAYGEAVLVSSASSEPVTDVGLLEGDSTEGSAADLDAIAQEIRENYDADVVLDIVVGEELITISVDPAYVGELTLQMEQQYGSVVVVKAAESADAEDDGIMLISEEGADTAVDEGRENQGFLQRVTSMTPAEWGVAAVLIALTIVTCITVKRKK